MKGLACSRTAHRYGLAGAFALMWAFLVFHFAMVVLYNARPNPVKLRHHRLIGRYMDPLFTQDWHLFSPTPVNFDVILLLRARVRKGDGSIVETSWVDITTPLLEKLHRHRLSSLGSLAHIQAYTLLARGPSPAYREFQELLCRGGPPAPGCREDSPVLEAQRRMAERLTARVASAHAWHLFGAHEIVAVQVRTLLSRFPRFSERHTPGASPRLTVADSPWMPYESVDPFR